MGRKKVDRSDKVMQTFESSKPLVERLKETAKARDITVSGGIATALTCRVALWIYPTEHSTLRYPKVLPRWMWTLSTMAKSR